MRVIRLLLLSVSISFLLSISLAAQHTFKALASGAGRFDLSFASRASGK
jgi:hypothetical protein